VPLDLSKNLSDILAEFFLFAPKPLNQAIRLHSPQVSLPNKAITVMID
jgi:hypothetical protein